MKKIRSKNSSVPGVLKSFIKFIVFLLLGLGLLYWVFRSQDVSYQAYCASHQIAPGDCVLWKKMLKDFLSVKWIYIFFIFIAFFLSGLNLYSILTGIKVIMKNKSAQKLVIFVPYLLRDCI